MPKMVETVLQNLHLASPTECQLNIMHQVQWITSARLPVCAGHGDAGGRGGRGRPVLPGRAEGAPPTERLTQERISRIQLAPSACSADCASLLTAPCTIAVQGPLYLGFWAPRLTFRDPHERKYYYINDHRLRTPICLKSHSDKW